MMLSALDQVEIEESKELLLSDEKDGWKVDSLDSANWALRKINALQKKVASTKQLSKQEMDRISQWEQKEIESDTQSIQFFEEKLGDYLRVLRQMDPKVRIKTPYGSVGTRKINAKIAYDHQIIDELKAKGLTEYIRVTEDVNKAELKKTLTILDNGIVITADGERLQHAIVEQGYEKIVVRTVN